jgi:hypothetical protein
VKAHWTQLTEFHGIWSEDKGEPKKDKGENMIHDKSEDDEHGL